MNAAGALTPGMRALAGAGLVVVGAGLLLIGNSLPEREAEVSGASAPVNAGARDRRVIVAHNSPSVARNPARPENLAATSRIDFPQFSCALHVSHDSGRSWIEAEVPSPAGEELPERCFAPDVAFGHDGVLHMSFVTLSGAGNLPNALWVTSSTDGGRTLSTPTRVAGRLAFQARLAADPSRPGRLYLTWVQAAGTAGLGYDRPGNPIHVARSDDGGRTWGPPRRVTGPARPRSVSPSIKVGHTGEVHVLHLELGDDALDYHGAHEGRGGEPYQGSWSLVLQRSSDGGATWQEAEIEDRLVPTQRFIVFEAPFPSLALGPGGRVYAAFVDGRLGDPDVWLWTSHDGGRRFGSPRRVNDTAPGDARAQYLPEVAVAPGGRVDVVYYDRRSDPDDIRNEVSLQSSFSRGASFLPRITLSDLPFDSRIGFGSERGMPDLGSRLALLSSRTAALAVWTDTRGGNDVATKQDLARAVVRFSERSPTARPLQVASVAAVLAGAAALAWAAAGWRRRSLKIS